MKILLVNDYATPTAGAEIMMLLLRDELRRRGHEVRMFASRAELIPGGASFADYTCFGTTSRWQVVSSTFNPSAWWALRKALRAFRPDLVHVKMFLWQLSPAILPLLSDVPSLYHAVTYKAVCPLGTKMLPDGSRCTVRPGAACRTSGCLTWQSWLFMMVQRKLFRGRRHAFNAVIANSEAVRERLAEDGVTPVVVVPNGTLTREKRKPLSDPPLFGYAGRLSSEKGVDTLLLAFARLKDAVADAKLCIAGDGPLSSSLRQLASDLGIADRVEFTGSLPRTDLEQKFDSLWVQVIPSVWDEPFGLVAIEGMMRGTALIATGTGGLRDIIRHGTTGLLVPPKNVDVLADALLQLAADRHRCEQMGDAGRQVALAEYTAATHADRVEAVYSEIMQRGERRIDG